MTSRMGTTGPSGLHLRRISETILPPQLKVRSSWSDVSAGPAVRAAGVVCARSLC
jgi:hypothetical protein